MYRAGTRPARDQASSSPNASSLVTGSAVRHVASSWPVIATMIRSHQAAAARSATIRWSAPVSLSAASRHSKRGRGSDASGDDPYSHDRTVSSATPDAAARLASLMPADRRAPRRTAPATTPARAVRSLSWPAWSLARPFGLAEGVTGILRVAFHFAGSYCGYSERSPSPDAGELVRVVGRNG